MRATEAAGNTGLPDTRPARDAGQTVHRRCRPFGTAVVRATAYTRAMFVPRRALRRLVVWLVFGLLASQWAVAAYVCPMTGAAPANAPPAAMPAMPGCDGSMAATDAMDTDQPQLCKAHCEQGAQSVKVTPAAEPLPSYSLWAVLDWQLPVLQPAAAVRERAHPSPAASPPGSPPIYLALRVLRN